jgi:hypothetical protein
MPTWDLLHIVSDSIDARLKPAAQRDRRGNYNEARQPVLR